MESDGQLKLLAQLLVGKESRINSFDSLDNPALWRYVRLIKTVGFKARREVVNKIIYDFTIDVCNLRMSQRAAELDELPIPEAVEKLRENMMSRCKELIPGLKFSQPEDDVRDSKLSWEDEFGEVSSQDMQDRIDNFYKSAYPDSE